MWDGMGRPLTSCDGAEAIEIRIDGAWVSLCYCMCVSELGVGVEWR